MSVQKTFATMLIVALLFGNLVAQQANLLAPKSPEISAELRKNAVEFLHQTIKEIPNLKAEENRQYFTIETARLLWKYDEKESRAMFERVIQEVKQSFTKTAEKYKKAVEEMKKARKNTNVNYAYYNAANRPANVNASNYYVNTTGYYQPEVSLYEIGMTDEFRKVASLRRNLLDNLTEVELDLAYQFLTETNQILPKDQRDYLYPDYGWIEIRIVEKLLEKNEIDKSVKIARNVLNKEFTEGFLSLLSAIYIKDAVKGSSLAEETLQKIKTLNVNELNTNSLTMFFDYAVTNVTDEQPMLSDKSLRELAKLLGQNVLAAMDREYYFTPLYYAKRIEKYAPREALKILQKSKQRRNTNSNRYPANYPYYPKNYPANYPINYPVNYAANAANTAARAANAAANAANRATNIPANRKKTNSNANSSPQLPEVLPTPSEYEQKTESIAELMQKLSIGKFTADERKNIIKQAKEYALASNNWGYTRPDRFISVVAELARFSIVSADKEISDELMKEAEIYLRPETKNYLDYVGKLLIAGGYSRHQPDKSFILMESMATINEVIESAVKVGVFIDSESTFISNNEVSASLFLGDLRMARGISQSGELQIFIQNLAKADFQRTKNLADKFDKKEFKMTAKMLILESLLNEAQESMRGHYY